MNASDAALMSAIVKAILKGKWTSDLPEWADRLNLQQSFDTGSVESRAVQTAEAFMMVLLARYPGYDERRFLKDCGLTR